MTTATAAIARHLNVVESAVVRVEEWANVMFAVVKGIGARFVSKKVVKVEKVEVFELVELIGSPKQIAWAQELRAEFFNMGIDRLGQEMGAMGWICRMAKELGSDDKGVIAMQKVARFAAQQTSASWWIDNRNALDIRLNFKSAYKRLAREIV